MTETAITLFISIVTALGGFEAIKYFINRKSERRKSDAEAAKEVQDVYQQMIADVKGDREEQRAYIEELKDSRKHLREECEELRQRIDGTDKVVRELQKEVARNARMVESLRPFICGFLGCKNRKFVTISEDGEIERDEQEDIDPVENSVQ